MYRTWTSSADDAATLARELEIHLNEYAEQVVSICYAVSGGHHVLVVYKEIETLAIAVEEAAVAEAEHIIDGGSL